SPPGNEEWFAWRKVHRLEALVGRDASRYHSRGLGEREVMRLVGNKVDRPADRISVGTASLATTQQAGIDFIALCECRDPPPNRAGNGRRGEPQEQRAGGRRAPPPALGALVIRGIERRRTESEAAFAWVGALARHLRQAEVLCRAKRRQNNRAHD